MKHRLEKALVFYLFVGTSHRDNRSWIVTRSSCSQNHQARPNHLCFPQDEVVRITNEMGDEAGSDELLDRLVNYPGWYPCLMKVLQDKDVQMSDLAKYISETLGEYDTPDINLLIVYSYHGLSLSLSEP